MKKTIHYIQEFSLPLIIGVIAAMITANCAPELYHWFVDSPTLGIWDFHHHDAHGAHAEGIDWAHILTMHFLVNDIFMVLFFGIAAKEIVEACLPGGALNPVSKAINPLLATVGGVLGPITVFLSINYFFGDPSWSRGWGIPTATDIALAWLAAKLIFGKGHPAISFLLLLAIADDAIGLGIIAIAYPDPSHPTNWMSALLLLPAMGIAFGLRKMNVRSWLPYVVFGGGLSWFALFSAHLHPALALVFIVPFMPSAHQDEGLFVSAAKPLKDTLNQFEHFMKPIVDFGLFFFAFCNGGVMLGGMSGLTWVLLLAMLLGKSIGITFFSVVGHWCGFKLPAGMGYRELFVTSVIAAIGLTVALFVAQQAYVDPAILSAAKMGALLSVVAMPLAWAIKMSVSKRAQQRSGSSMAGSIPGFQKTAKQAGH